jgi:hypothetical protein
MLWKLNSDGNVEQLSTLKASVSSNAGMVSAYDIGGNIYVETNDMCQVGIFKDKFLKEAMPQIRKSLRFPEPDTIGGKPRMGK